MKQLLKLGYQWYVLPDSANLNRLMKELGDAREVEHHWVDHKEFYSVGAPAEVELKMVHDAKIIEPTKRKRIPETTGGPY